MCAFGYFNRFRALANCASDAHSCASGAHVAAGVPPAVEPGILPGGQRRQPSPFLSWHRLGPLDFSERGSGVCGDPRSTAPLSAARTAAVGSRAGRRSNSGVALRFPPQSMTRSAWATGSASVHARLTASLNRIRGRFRGNLASQSSASDPTLPRIESNDRAA
jgi:hypothetical protein